MIVQLLAAVETELSIHFYETFGHANAASPDFLQKFLT